MNERKREVTEVPAKSDGIDFSFIDVVVKNTISAVKN